MFDFIHKVNYHQNPHTLHIGCEAPRAYFVPFHSETAALGGKRVEVGRASISYGASASGAAVSFGKAFTNPPVVLAMQVFDSVPLTVHTDDITEAGFMARVKGGFASAGTREFGWVAIGE